jgi:glycosyltransferase involved in cell wall biosynthesis
MLVTCRSRGTNTPLKIYQYLRAGKPIVATNILSHTQVLDPTIACLVDPEPEALAEGILGLAGDPERARLLAENAGHVAETRYSMQAYMTKLETLIDEIVSSASPRSAISVP